MHEETTGLQRSGGTLSLSLGKSDVCDRARCNDLVTGHLALLGLLSVLCGRLVCLCVCVCVSMREI